MVRRFRFGVVVALLASILVAAQENKYQPKYSGDPARSQSEFIALAYMRTISDAQRLYRKKHKKFAPSLTALVGSGSFTRRMVKTDRGDYQGSFHPGVSHFSLEMTPKTLDSTHRAFWVNENGYFHVEEDRPATADSPVLKPDNK
ncbi:MAG: hypothetical protein DMG67_17220 [Acidobacteria bacterium]|nr:MAG: hypothetical protein DMG67_17220 [Acidobacteriota bacterium]